MPVKQNNVVQISGQKIGDGNIPFIIAEAGMNHNGSLQLAFSLRIGWSTTRYIYFRRFGMLLITLLKPIVDLGCSKFSCSKIQ